MVVGLKFFHFSGSFEAESPLKISRLCRMVVGWFHGSTFDKKHQPVRVSNPGRVTLANGYIPCIYVYQTVLHAFCAGSLRLDWQ